METLERECSGSDHVSIHSTHFQGNKAWTLLFCSTPSKAGKESLRACSQPGMMSRPGNVKDYRDRLCHAMCHAWMGQCFKRDTCYCRGQFGSDGDRAIGLGCLETDTVQLGAVT